MAVKYRLIERKNLGNDKTETPKKQYAQVIYGDLVEFETFLEEVADGSGVGSASQGGTRPYQYRVETKSRARAQGECRRIGQFPFWGRLYGNPYHRGIYHQLDQRT